MATWPTSLPTQFEVGLRDIKQNGLLRSEPDQGPALQRRRFTATGRLLEGAMTLDAAQRATLDTFFDVTLSQGSLGFSFTDPVNLAAVTARFTRPPQFAAIDGDINGAALWSADISMEILP